MINLRQSRKKPAKLRLTAVVISTVITVFPEKIKPTVNSLDSKTSALILFSFGHSIHIRTVSKLLEPVVYFSKPV